MSEKRLTEISMPITLHIGDYNMDGYPDALAILKNTSGSNQQAFCWRTSLAIMQAVKKYIECLKSTGS